MSDVTHWRGSVHLSYDTIHRYENNPLPGLWNMHVPQLWNMRMFHISVSDVTHVGDVTHAMFHNCGT